MSTKRSVKKIVSRIKPRYIDLNKVVTQRACMRALIRKHGYKRTKCILGFVKAYEEGIVIRIRDSGRFSIEEYANIIYCNLKAKR
jgi:hypothetical protein